MLLFVLFYFIFFNLIMKTKIFSFVFFIHIIISFLGGYIFFIPISQYIFNLKFVSAILATLSTFCLGLLSILQLSPSFSGRLLDSEHLKRIVNVLLL